jgi:hypothetical protein
MKMVSAARKVFLVTGALCFISMATGATLQFHLLSYEHTDQHNPETCAICKYLLVHSPKFLYSPDIQIICFEHYSPDQEIPVRSFIQTIQLKAFDPRPPPIS